MTSITITTPSLYHRRVSLNKRPPLIRSSSPSSSVQNIQRKSSFSNNKETKKPKKSVRFCDNASLENVRLFLKTQMPKACRSDPTCPKQYTYRLRKSNWPAPGCLRQQSAVRLEDIQLNSNTRTLTGTCQVANLAFEKHVQVRYSFDSWTTVKQLDAIYQEPIANSANTWDRFCFKIILNSSATTVHETLQLAVKYTVSGREFWDNNDEKNYQLDILPQVQLYDELSSSSSSDEEEDDEENTFEDCIDDEDEDLIQQLQPISLSDSRVAVFPTQKPWSPPLSPTTPADSSPLWMSASRLNSNTATPTTGYFNNNKVARDFHHLIHKYCFYNNNDRTTSPTFYNQSSYTVSATVTTPTRTSSPAPKAIRS